MFDGSFFKEPITRREALRRIAFGASTIVGTSLGLYKFDERTQLELRLRTFNEISNLPPTLKNKELRKSWFRFNLAEAYAHHEGWEVTQKSINNFLFGNNKDLDITANIEYLLNDPSDNFGSQIIEMGLNWNVFGSEDSFKSSISKKKIKKNIEQGDAFEFSFSVPSVAQRSIDLKNSLHMFNLHCNTLVSKSSHSQGGIVLTFSNTEFTIDDIYDWDPNLKNVSRKLTPYVLTDTALDSLGLSNVKIPDILNEIEISAITVQDGLNLVESGYGHPYKIYTNPIRINRPLEVKIRSSFFNS